MARLGLYQPFIEDRNVRRLYRLKLLFREREGRRVPMTVLVNRILDDFFLDSECCSERRRPQNRRAPPTE